MANARLHDSTVGSEPLLTTPSMTMYLALPTFSPSQARDTLDEPRYSAYCTLLTKHVSRILALQDAKFSRAASAFGASWLAFMQSYFEDEAFSRLKTNPAHPIESYTGAERTLRQRVFELSERCAASGDNNLTVSFSTLFSIALGYGLSNPTRVSSLIATSIDASPDLEQELVNEVIPAWAETLSILGTAGTVPGHAINTPSDGDSALLSLQRAQKSAQCLSAFLHVSPASVARAFANDRTFIRALGQTYDRGLAELARALGGIYLSRDDRISPQNPRQAGRAWQSPWLGTKLDLLDAFDVIVQRTMPDPVESRSASSPRPSAESQEPIFALLFNLLELPAGGVSPLRGAPANASAGGAQFLNHSLLAAYESIFALSEIIRSRFGDGPTSDPRAGFAAASVAALSTAPPRSGARVLVSLLPLEEKVPIHDIVPAQTVDVKGKGKAKAVTEAPLDLHDPALSQLTDIFPTHSRSFLYRCLHHPSFGGNVESVVSALLEGNPPPDLLQDEPEEAASTVAPGPHDEFVYTKDRRNVFDEDTMDFSKLRLGKNERNDADSALRDRSFLDDMKVDILRRVAEMSDEEEDGDAGLDDEPPTGGLVVRVQDGHADSEGELQDEPKTGPASRAQTPERAAGGAKLSDDKVQNILEQEYIQNASAFDRDAATRRSKARAELKARTGWGDEQLEGWRIMLERNPRKDKILQKHEFAGNRPRNGEDVEDESPVPPRAATSADRGRGRGGGGRGQGRGGRGHARKEENKARIGNHNRKRGHDKKMAQGGGPPA